MKVASRETERDQMRMILMTQEESRIAYSQSRA